MGGGPGGGGKGGGEGGVVARGSDGWWAAEGWVAEGSAAPARVGGGGGLGGECEGRNGEGGGGEGRWRRERRRAAAAEGGGGCEVEMARAAAARAAAVRVGGRAGRGGEGGRRRGAVAARVAEGWAAEAATAGTSTSRVDDGNSGRPRAGHGAGRRLASQSGPPRLSCDPWAPHPRPEARPTRRRCGCAPAPSGGAPQGHHLVRVRGVVALNIRGPTMAREWPCSHPQSSGPAPRWPVTGHIMHCLKSRQDDSARGTRPGDGGGWVVGCQPCSQHGRSPTAWDEVLGPSVGPVPQARLAHRASKSVVLAKCCGIFRETTANFSSSGRATREPGGLGRRPTTRTRRRTPEDHATLPRRSTRAQTALPRRSRLVWRSARLNQKCTTR